MRSNPADLPEGIQLLVAAEQTGDRDVLDRAIAWLSPVHESGGLMGAMLAMPTGRAYALRWEWGDENADAEKAMAVLSTVSAPVEAAVMARAMIGNLLGQRYERHGEQADLDAAIETLQAVIALTPRGTPQHTGRTRTLCRFLVRAGVDGESMTAFERAAEAARTALASALPGDPSRPYLVGMLGSAELERFRRGAIDDDLPAVRLIAESAQQVTDPGERHRVLLALGNAVSHRTRRMRDPADADHAVGLLEQAVRASPQRDPEVLVHLGVALTIRAELTLRPDDMRDAAATLSDAMTLAPPGSEARMRALGSLADARRQLVERTGDRAGLDATVDMANEAVSLAVSHKDEHAVGAAMCNLGLVLITRARLDNKPADLDLALRHLHAVEDQPTSSGNEAPRWNAIGQAYLMRYQMVGEPDDLREAVRRLDRALSASPVPAPQIVLSLGRCLVLLATKHEDLAGPDDLDRAVSLLRKAHDALGRTEETAEALGVALFAKYQVTGEHVLVEEANQLLDGRLQAHIARPPASVTFAEALVRGDALLDEYKATGRGAVLDAAVETLRAAVPGVDENPALVAELFSQLGISLRHRYLRHRRREDIDEAVAAGRRAVDDGPDGDRGLTGWLANLANAYRVRFENLHDNTDLDAAIAMASKAVEATSPGHRHYLSVHTSLANALMVRYEADGRQEDLDRAIDSSRIAAEGDKPRHLANLGAKLLQRETPADLDEAVGLLKRALDRYEPQDPERANVAVNLVRALDKRWAQDRRADDLDAMVDVAQRTFDGAVPGHPARVYVLGTLAEALHKRFQRDERREDLHRAIGLYQELLTLLDERSSEHAMVRANLGVALYFRHLHGGTETDLHEAIRLLEAIPEQFGVVRRINLALALRQRFLVAGDRADLRAAVHNLRTAAERSEDAHERGTALSNLSLVLCELAEIDDDTWILDEAVESARRAENLLPPEHPDVVAAVTHLCQSLRTRFERTSSPDDLDAAVEAGLRAVKLNPTNAGAQGALGNAYQTRYEWSDQLVDLEAAIGAHKAALSGFERGHPLFASAAHNLGNVLMRIYLVRGDRADLEESIRLSREAVTGTGPGDPTRATSLVSLGIAMRKRFAVTDDGNDLSEAIGAFRQALDCFAGHPDEPVRATVLVNLGNVLRDRYERVGLQSDLSDAIDSFKQAKASLQGTPRLAVVLRALGEAQLLGEQPAPHESLEAFREAAGLMVAEPQVRVGAAQSWGMLAHSLGDVEQAALGLAAAVGLLPLVTWHGLDAETRTRQLMRYRGLAADAAAAAVLAGRPDEAVELLEQGRSVLWNQALRFRSDLSAVAAVAPELARTLESIREELNTPWDSRATVDRWQLARKWDETVGQVRQIDDFEHFGEPVPYSSLRSAATGPVVIVNVSALGCHALVVQASADHAVPIALDDLTAEAAEEHAGLLFAILGRRPELVVPPDARNPLLLKILTWLWTSTVGHVLDHPSVVGALADSPRIWWCPTGPMAMLPLHAAGLHAEDGAADVTVSARAVSSYTPTLAALLRCRAAQRDFRDEPPRQLAVGLPETPGMSSLPAVRRELTHLKQYFPHGRQLVGADATREEVLVSLGSCSWAHWACHGEQNDADPAQSAFHVWDGPVTLSDLSAVSSTGVELAFLSACNTATGTTRLVDEALHLAATTQLLGYPHVVATLWSIQDFEAPGVADGFYRRLSTTGTPRSAGAAQALHESIEELRRSAADEPLVWAPYVHFGP